MAATLPPQPPRISGDPASDLIVLVEWLNDFWKVIALEGVFLATADQLADSSFDPSSLPDPASTTVGQAQKTANNAYLLADAAKDAADAAQTTADAAQADATAALARPRITHLGQITVADGATSGALSLSPAAADTSYFVSAVPVSSSGSPAAGAYRVVGVTKATGSVTIALEAAPGAGKSVTFDVTVSRA